MYSSCNNWNDNYWWIILVFAVILIWCCGGCGNGCGNTCGNTCGCGCGSNHNNCVPDDCCGGCNCR